jgi:hypothetical protein
MEVFPGPDGFLIHRQDPLFSAHLLVNDLLLQVEAAEQAHRGVPIADRAALRAIHPPQNAIDAQLAILARLSWLREARDQMENFRKNLDRLRLLLAELYRCNLPYSEADLITLIETTTPLLGWVPPYGPVESVQRHFDTDAHTAAIFPPLRAFQAHLKVEMSLSQASLQSLRQQIYLLLWQDESDPIDPDRCWSERVRASLRQMEGERRQRWRDLLRHIPPNAGTRPPNSWTGRARALIEAIPPDDRSTTMLDWFAPFSPDCALPLTVAGSHVLKAMLWYANLSAQREILDAALAFRLVPWKPKRHAEKVFASADRLLNNTAGG